MFGYGFGDLDALTHIHFNWLIIPITSAVSASLRAAYSTRFLLLITSTAAGVGQGFYAYRILILSRSRAVPAFVLCVRCRALSP